MACICQDSCAKIGESSELQLAVASIGRSVLRVRVGGVARLEKAIR